MLSFEYINEDVKGDAMILETNELAVRAATDTASREQLILENEQNILRTASLLCRRYISKSDDEWSVALGAFSHAVDIYDTTKGDFLPFAKMVIKRSLVDHYRSNQKNAREISVSPYTLEGNGEEDETSAEVSRAVARSSVKAADDSLAQEITAANKMLEEYGFRFFDVTTCSPKQDRSREDCAAVIRSALGNADILTKLRKTRKLPVREVCAASGISRKSVDRYRKYLIMAILILDGDYPHLSGYLAYVRKGGTN